MTNFARKVARAVMNKDEMKAQAMQAQIDARTEAAWRRRRGQGDPPSGANADAWQDGYRTAARDLLEAFDRISHEG